MRIAAVVLFALVAACSSKQPDVRTHSSALVFEPASHDFGTVETGTSVTRRYVIKPNKNVDWEREYIRSVTSDCAAMKVDAPGLPAEVSRMCPDGMGGVTYGAECAAGLIDVKEISYAFDVTFAPTVQGTYTCRILVDFTNYGFVALGANGIGKRPDFALSISPPINFGNVKADVTSSAGEIRIKNIGGRNHDVGPITFTDGGGVFTLENAPAGTVALVPDGEIRMQVKCKPPGFATYAGKVSFMHQVPSLPKPFEVALTCTGLDTKIVLAPTAVNFATTRVGEPVDVDVTIQNTGNINDRLVTVSFQAASPAIGFVTQPSNVVLQSAGTNAATAKLRYAPIAPTPRGTLGFLRLEFESETPQLMPITGEALLADPESDPPTADFGVVCIGETATKTIDVFDGGLGGFVINNVALTSQTFTVAPTVTLPHAVQGDRADEVRFTVTAAPMMESKITRTAIIGTDAPTLAHRNLLVNLVVEGAPAGVSASPKRVRFEERPIGKPTYRKHVTLSNCNASPTTVSSVSFDGPDREDFSLVDEFEPQELEGKGELVIDVQAVPSHGGELVAQLVVETSAGMVLVDLSGSGEAETVVPPAVRDTYYTCGIGHGSGAFGVALALAFVVRRRRRNV